VDELPPLRPLEPVAVLGLNGELKEVYDAGILQVWYLSIDIHSILFHVKFEDGLSIPFMKERQLATEFTTGRSKSS
jgi:hypothetical protein